MIKNLNEISEMINSLRNLNAQFQVMEGIIRNLIYTICRLNGEEVTYLLTLAIDNLILCIEEKSENIYTKVEDYDSSKMAERLMDVFKILYPNMDIQYRNGVFYDNNPNQT